MDVRNIFAGSHTEHWCNALIAIARQRKKTSALKLDPKLQKGKRNNRKQTKKREKWNHDANSVQRQKLVQVKLKQKYKVRRSFNHNNRRWSVG